MKRLTGNWLYFLRHIFYRYGDDNCFSLAGALTFTTLLAIVPLMLVGLSVFVAFPEFQSLGERVQNFIFSTFVPETGEVIQQNLNKFVQQASHLSIIGLAFLFVTAVFVLFTVEKSLNIIWRVRRARKSLMAFLLYWAILTFTPILLGVSITLSTYVVSLPVVQDFANQLGLGWLWLSLLPFVLSFIAFTLLYTVIPNTHVPLSSGTGGAAIAAFLFECARMGFGTYIKHFSSYMVVYGTLSSIPVFLLWLYISWCIILFGAEVSCSLAFRASLRFGERLGPFQHCLRWLYHLYDAQQQGELLNVCDLVKRDNRPYEVSPEDQLRHLEKGKLITRVGHERFILNVNVASMTLFEIYERLPWKVTFSGNVLVDNEWENQFKTILQEEEIGARQSFNVPLKRLFHRLDSTTQG